MHKQLPSEKLPSLFLRIGLAIVFIYAAVSAFQNPGAWLGFVPPLVTHFISADLFLQVFSVIQLILAMVLLSGKYAKYAAILSALFLAGIVVTNFSAFIVTFRDIALVFMAVALYFLEK